MLISVPFLKYLCFEPPFCFLNIPGPLLLYSHWKDSSQECFFFSSDIFIALSSFRAQTKHLRKECSCFALKMITNQSKIVTISPCFIVFIGLLFDILFCGFVCVLPGLEYNSYENEDFVFPIDWHCEGNAWHDFLSNINCMANWLQWKREL